MARHACGHALCGANGEGGAPAAVSTARAGTGACVRAWCGEVRARAGRCTPRRTLVGAVAGRCAAQGGERRRARRGGTRQRRAARRRGFGRALGAAWRGPGAWRGRRAAWPGQSRRTVQAVLGHAAGEGKREERRGKEERREEKGKKGKERKREKERLGEKKKRKEMGEKKRKRRRREREREGRVGADRGGDRGRSATRARHSRAARGE
jgi:hypothetical protein